MALLVWYCYYCGTQMTLLNDDAQLYGCTYCGARNWAPAANVDTTPNVATVKQELSLMHTAVGELRRELHTMQQTHATSRKQ